jgi:hypothetical protein
MREVVLLEKGLCGVSRDDAGTLGLLVGGWGALENGAVVAESCEDDAGEETGEGSADLGGGLVVGG